MQDPCASSGHCVHFTHLFVSHNAQLLTGMKYLGLDLRSEMGNLLYLSQPASSLTYLDS